MYEHVTCILERVYGFFPPLNLTQSSNLRHLQEIFFLLFFRWGNIKENMTQK